MEKKLVAKPKVSIIVPSYNSERTIRRCIDSILQQSFCDFELLLIDDGSIDKSKRICEEYYHKDERIKVICKKNGGGKFCKKFRIGSSKRRMGYIH